VSWPVLTVQLRQEPDIVLARQRARQIAEQLGFERQDQTRIATAVSEIARNAFSYGGGGKVEFSVDAGTPQGLVVRVVDQGPGIADLEGVLSGSYVSPTGMGVGLVGARRLMDGFDIRSAPGQGVEVVLVKHIPARRLRLGGAQVGELARRLQSGGDADADAELRETNHALMASLEELRLRQDEMGQLNAELEDTNRGVVALYAELDQTAEKLRAASEAKSRFLSHISHELRTPLNSIRALSGLLLDEVDGPLTPEQTRQVGYIRKSAETLTDLVNDLLDIAKVEAGKTEAHIGAFEVEDLLAGLRGLLKPLQAASGAELVFEDCPPLPTMQSDEAKVAQILRNLISNALKFTEQGEVRVAARQEPDGAIVFTVRDTGIGLAPEDQGRIFEEFEQVAGALQAKFKGTGLGLPLSRRLAELLGGSLSVESRLGEGSTFTLRLPADIRPVVKASQCVLLVDDEEAFRYALRQMVGTDHQILEAEDGVQALEVLKGRTPDVMFLDLNMPRLDGYAVLAEVAADPARAGLVVIVSTSAMLNDRDRARLERADYVLTKDQLSRETVRALLAGGGA
jgi:signal transduction histidine kinase